MEDKIQITKSDLDKGDLVKTCGDSWLVSYDKKTNKKILVSTNYPDRTMSLSNYTDDLIDIRRFIQKNNLSSNSYEDIIAVKKKNSTIINGWDYTRENAYFLNEGFKVNLINKED